MQTCFIPLVATVFVMGVSAYFPDKIGNIVGVNFANTMLQDDLLLDKFIKCLLDEHKEPICEEEGMLFCVGIMIASIRDKCQACDKEQNTTAAKISVYLNEHKPQALKEITKKFAQ